MRGSNMVTEQFKGFLYKTNKCNPQKPYVSKLELGTKLRGQYKDVNEFIKELDKNIADLKMDENLAHRYLNEGFSGGEKKRNEILQMKLLKPKFALLDEIDSGLDVDALKIVSEAINDMKSDSFGCVMVSHYERLFELVPPSHVHILVDGKIVKTGGQELAREIEEKGYSQYKN